MRPGLVLLGLALLMATASAAAPSQFARCRDCPSDMSPCGATVTTAIQGLSLGHVSLWSKRHKRDTGTVPGTCLVVGQASQSRIAYVIDGDTVVLANGEHVRLVQIDAPEVQEHECYGAQARTVLRRLAPPGSTVRVEGDPRLDDVDRYGRLLRYLFRGPTNLNLELVREGAATVWLYHHDRGRYADALLRTALNARAAHRGLWGTCPRTPFDPYHAATTGRSP